MQLQERKIPIQQECGLDLIREVLFGKWKIHLLYYIGTGIKRPGQLHKQIHDASRRVLNMKLKSLEEDGFIAKTVFNQKPFKVECDLTTIGKSVLPIITTFGQWGDDNQEHLKKAINKKINFL
jgi:DNA-binding HxlR family transcriptional regulator